MNLPLKYSEYSKMQEKIDVIIFGASGFSGKYVVRKFYEILKNEERNVTWGIAGRSKTRLQIVLQDLELKTGVNFQNIPIFEADTKNETSLTTMASKTRLIINCTGPYKVHGQPVIQACIKENCHYVDITAEPQFMERMQLLYNEEAAMKGVYVVTACGINSIPADMGLNFLQKNFEGTLNSVECYQELLPENNFGKGAIVNYGTWDSFLYMMADYAELKKIRRKLFKTNLPELEPTLSMRKFLHKIPFSENYAGPYPGGEATVMRRSQRYFYENDHVRPIQVHTYVGTPKFWHYIVVFFSFLLLVKLLKLIPSAVTMLLKYPKQFTLGFFDTVEPEEETLEKIKFVTTFYGRGWRGKSVDEKFKEAEDSWMVAKVSGVNGYTITGLCAAISALVLLDGGQTLPKRGGVYTTAAVFTNTDLVQVLQRNGLNFEVCGQGSL